MNAEQTTEIAREECDEMFCVGCGATVLDQGGDETLGWLGDDEGWFCPSCCERDTPPGKPAATEPTA